MWPTARAHTYTHTQGTDGKQKRTHTAKAMPYSLVVQLRQSGSHFAIEPVTSRRGNDRKARPATATTIISIYNNNNNKTTTTSTRYPSNHWKACRQTFLQRQLGAWSPASFLVFSAG